MNNLLIIQIIIDDQNFIKKIDDISLDISDSPIDLISVIIFSIYSTINIVVTKKLYQRDI